MATKIESTNIDDIDFIKEVPGVVLPMGGAMLVTFKRNGDKYAYYPMLKEVYDFHEKEMTDNKVSAGSHFRKNIQNLYQSKKI